MLLASPVPRHPPCRRVIYKTSRGAGLRGRRQFLTSRAVYPTDDSFHPACGVQGQRGSRCIRRAFYFVPRARGRARAHTHTHVRALSFSPSFFPVFLFLRLFYATARFFHLFWSTLDCSATTNQDHLTGNTPRTRHRSPLVSAASPTPLRATHFCFPSSLLRAGIFAAAIAIRSLTNLFDKSPRLIGLTTRPRLFFPSVKFTVVARSLVAPVPSQILCLRPFRPFSAAT